MSKCSIPREFTKGERVYIRQDGGIFTPGDVVRVDAHTIKVLAEDNTTVDFDRSQYGKPTAFLLGRDYCLDSVEDYQNHLLQERFLRKVNSLADHLRRLPRERAQEILQAAEAQVEAYDQERLSFLSNPPTITGGTNGPVPV